MQGLGFAGTPTSPVAAVPVPRQWPWHDGERLHPQGADERLHTDPSISSAWLLDILSMLLPEFLQQPTEQSVIYSIGLLQRPSE